MSITERIARMVTDLFTIPPVVTGNRLEIHNRLKSLLEREGVTAMTSSWNDGCRMVPVRRTKRRITRAVKGK